MKRSTLIVLKALVWIASLLPLTYLVKGAIASHLGPDPGATIVEDTGLTTLWMLAILLAITPARRVFPKLSWLIKFRRLIGLFVFFYASIHFLSYLGLYVGFDLNTLKTDLTRRRFVIAGFAAWLTLLPLAATSTTWAIRKMGGRNWNRLHKLVYAAAIFADAHYWWKVKTGVLSPAPFTVVLTLLLGARPILWWVHQRKRTAAVAATHAMESSR